MHHRGCSLMQLQSNQPDWSQMRLLKPAINHTCSTTLFSIDGKVFFKSLEANAITTISCFELYHYKGILYLFIRPLLLGFRNVQNPKIMNGYIKFAI
ncbi:unnamed protein product [Boreogadus saida]